MNGAIKRFRVEKKNAESKFKGLKYAGVLVVALCMVCGSFGYLLGAAPASAPNTVLDWEGLEAYKINGVRYANPDDVDSIQDALDNMTSGGLLVIPAGDYTSIAQIEIMYNWTAVIGVGWATHIYSTYGHSGLYINEKSNILIKDIWLEGAGIAAGGTDLGVNMLTCEYVTVTNCRFTEWPNDPLIIHGPDTHDCGVFNSIFSECAEGPELKGGTCNVISGCQLNNITEEAIEITMRPDYDEQSSNHLIANNIMHNIGQIGIWVYENVSSCTIIGNIINDTLTGIQIAGIATAIPSNIHITGNSISYASSSAIRINNVGWENIRISDNSIHIYNAFGIYVIAGGQNLSLDGNFISNGYGATADAISITSATRNVTVTDNTILDPARYGVSCSTPSASILNNVIRGGSVAVFLSAVTVAGESQIVSGNRIDHLTSTGVKIQTANWANVVISDNYFTDITSNAISCSVAGSNLLITGNIINEMGGTLDAISLSGVIVGVVISNNQILDTSRYAINLAVQDAMITGNLFRGTTSIGLYCTNGTGAVISNNIFMDYTGSGIRLTAASTYITILGNRFTAMPYGILETAGADYIYVLCNNFEDCATGTYTLAGVNNVYANNTGI